MTAEFTCLCGDTHLCPTLVGPYDQRRGLDFEALADEAERGYDVEGLVDRS